MWLQAGVYPLVCWCPISAVFFLLRLKFLIERQRMLPKFHTTNGAPFRGEASATIKCWKGLPGEISRAAASSIYPEKRGGFFSGWSHQQNWPPLHFCSRTGPCSQAHTDLPHRHSFHFLAPSLCCLSFLITIPFLPTDLQASFQVPLPEAGACSLASCCLLVGRELQTVELTHRITTGGHCWTLTNIINTPVVAAGLFFKFTLIKISLIFKT